MFNLFLDRHCNILYKPQYFHTPYIGCLHEIEIQCFKYGYLIGQTYRLGTKLWLLGFEVVYFSKDTYLSKAQERSRTTIFRFVFSKK